MKPAEWLGLWTPERREQFRITRRLARVERRQGERRVITERRRIA